MKRCTRGDPNLRVPLVLCDMDELSYEEVAETLGIAASAGSKYGGIGMNKRTGEFLGGGDLGGTLIGALAGGGKGAAIGALAGGAAGAGAQVLTRGKTLSVPAETNLKFRLKQTLVGHSSTAATTHHKTVPPPK